jgi:hypothetical protein
VSRIKVAALVTAVGLAVSAFATVAPAAAQTAPAAAGKPRSSITANPEHVLRETNYANDITLRKIIITGTRVTVTSGSRPMTE